MDNLRYHASIVETLKFEAEEKVRKDERVELAKRMKDKKMNPIDISEITGLSLEEIDEL